MIFRTLGANWFPALFAKQVETEFKPARTYEQACKEHYDTMSKLIGQFLPVYFCFGRFYYMVIDELTVVEVDTNAGRKSCTVYTTPVRHEYFDLIINHQLEKEGYVIISALEFHKVFTCIQNNTNLTINQAIQSSL